MKSNQASRHLPLVVAVCLLAPAAVLVAARRGESPSSPAKAEMAEGRTQSRTSATTVPAAVALRPLPVERATDRHEWTAGDLSSPELIEKIAHNPDEFIRMVEENDRIERRQLVYRNDTAAAAVQRARASGEPLRALTLPGLDGQELEFEIVRADLEPSGLKGSFAGRLAGKPESMVILSFKGDREAFSVSSPADDLHLQADPREPGEIVVKRIDPATYIQGGCGVLGSTR